MKYVTIIFNSSLFISLSQYLKKLFKSVSLRKSTITFCTVTSTKDTNQTTKNQISLAESLMLLLRMKKLLFSCERFLNLRFYLTGTFQYFHYLHVINNKKQTTTLLIEVSLNFPLKWSWYYLVN